MTAQSSNAEMETQGVDGTELDESSNHVKISVNNSATGVSLTFKLKKTASFKKMMDAFCQRTNTKRGETRFSFDGRCISESGTAKELGLMDNDIIEVYSKVDGGGY